MGVAPGGAAIAAAPGLAGMFAALPAEFPRMPLVNATAFAAG